MKSVMSFPNRGHWGDAKWRGNTSGHVIKELISHYKPKHFVDICEGSGTSRDVCQEMNIPYHGLDLHSGFDYTTMSVLNAIGGMPADMVFSHPSYHNMITYSGNQWGSANLQDHSRCSSVDEFLAKSEVMLLNQREATVENGHYATLIGDHRSKEVGFQSYQADFIKMMPRNELVSVAIKMQHNCLSDTRVYSGNFVPIMHEYLLIWRRSARSLIVLSMDHIVSLQKSASQTWRSVVRMIMMQMQEPVALKVIYEAVAEFAEPLIAKNPHWQAKIRQTLQKHHTNVSRGIWVM